LRLGGLGRSVLAAGLGGLAWLGAGSAALGQAPANDLCVNAQAIPITAGGSGLVSGSNTTATNDTGLPTCFLSASAGSGTKGVWYTFVGTGNVVELNTCGTARDLVLRVFCGTSCTDLLCAASDDDGCDGSTSSSPRLSMCTTPGTVYRVLLSRFGGSSGTGIAFNLFWSDSGSPCPAGVAPLCAAGATPSNDDCAGALPVTIGSTTLGSTINALTEIDTPSCGGPSPERGVWFSFTGTGGNVIASTCSSQTGSNTKVYIYSGACGALTCVDGSNSPATPCLDRGDAASAAITCTTLGETYYVLVTSDGSSGGLFALTLTGFGCAPPPPNDKCDQAAAIAPGASVTVDNTWATGDPSAAILQGVWYTYTPPTNQRVEFSTCNAGTTFDSRMALFYGACGNNGDELLYVDAVLDNDPPCDILGTSATITACLIGGRTYYICVGADRFGGTGNLQLNVTLLPDQCGPANDSCATAEAITPGTPIFASSFDASDDVGMPVCGAIVVPDFNNGVWYSYTHSGAPQRFRLSTCQPIGPDPFDPPPGNSYDTALFVYSGSCATLACIDGNDNSLAPCGDREDESVVEFCAQPGVTYYFLVSNGPSASDGGLFNLLLETITGTCAADPTGECCNAGACSVTTQAACTGTWTAGGTCSPGPCAPVSVVCCRGSTCATVASAGDCTPPSGAVVGAVVSPAAACGVTNSATAGCCYADFNKAGGVTIDDIFIYLNAWFAASEFSNVGEPGSPNIDDIFIFLNAWFAGC
jgi:hypothetical protein